MKHLKIQLRLILDLESPPEYNSTLEIPIRASEPRLLTKVNSWSKFHNFSNLGPQIFVSAPNSIPSTLIDNFDILKLLWSTEFSFETWNSEWPEMPLFTNFNS